MPGRPANPEGWVQDLPENTRTLLSPLATSELNVQKKSEDTQAVPGQWKGTAQRFS